MRTLVIDAAALARNLDRLRRAASARIIGVVKGNGYGLGLTDYARFLTEHGVDMLAVSTAEEAAALRQAGIAAEVLMLSSTAVPRDVAVLLDCGAILTVGSCAAAETVSAVAAEKGGNRQELHERLRQHAIAAGKQVKEEGLPNDMVDRIAADPAFGLTKEEIVAGLVPENFVGRAPQQVEEFIANVLQPIFDANPDAVEQHASLSV